MLDTELFQIMRNIVITVTGLDQVIMSNPNAPSPSGEYCAISIKQPTRQRSQASVNRTNVDQQEGAIKWIGVNHELRTNCQTDVSINFYRGDAHQFARKVFGANKRPDISAYLFTNGVGWLQESQVNNLTALQSENWENRAQLTVTLMYTETSDVETNAIYKVPIEIQDESGDIIEEDVVSTPVGVEYAGYGNAQYGNDQYEPDEIIP